mmetsp:Transcript_2932/g.7042  ORF Transcript_2932/g.7042 Transcript_2932/m.7042 type:complete len:401 (-) Transcript_2932:3874-5076(-)
MQRLWSSIACEQEGRARSNEFRSSSSAQAEVGDDHPSTPRVLEEEEGAHGDVLRDLLPVHVRSSVLHVGLLVLAMELGVKHRSLELDGLEGQERRMHRDLHRSHDRPCGRVVRGEVLLVAGVEEGEDGEGPVYPRQERVVLQLVVVDGGGSDRSEHPLVVDQDGELPDRPAEVRGHGAVEPVLRCAEVYSDHISLVRSMEDRLGDAARARTEGNARRRQPGPVGEEVGGLETAMDAVDEEGRVPVMALVHVALASPTSRAGIELPVEVPVVDLCDCVSCPFHPHHHRRVHREPGKTSSLPAAGLCSRRPDQHKQISSLDLKALGCEGAVDEPLEEDVGEAGLRETFGLGDQLGVMKDLKLCDVSPVIREGGRRLEVNLQVARYEAVPCAAGLQLLPQLQE